MYQYAGSYLGGYPVFIRQANVTIFAKGFQTLTFKADFGTQPLTRRFFQPFLMANDGFTRAGAVVLCLSSATLFAA